MKFRERRVALLSIRENIEMELFSSEESCMVITTLEKEEECSYDQRHLEHPLVPDSEEEEKEEEEEEEMFFEAPLRQQHEVKPRTEPRVKDLVKHHSPLPGFMEDTEIEMEVFLPLRVSDRKSPDGSGITLQTPNKASRLKWKRQTPQRTGLVVKDVICLPRGYYLEQLERPVAPRGKDRAALVATGMTARITIDSGWSANQMESRLVMLFQGRFVKEEGQKFSFTYLQSVQGSKVLFFPDTPAEGWTGEQVLRTAGHGALHILSHQDCPQPHVCSSTVEVSLLTGETDKRASTVVLKHVSVVQIKPDLETILRQFQLENENQDVETHIQVRRGDLLNSALKVVRKPAFCFRTTPIVSFIEEETDSHGGLLGEFFRLVLLELQHTSVFEGYPGRLFLTYDLSALEDRKYYEAGVLIGWSLAQGGPGPCCLHPALYQMMCGQNPPLEDFNWKEIIDAEARNRLQQLQRCTDVKLLSPSLCEWLFNCGISEIHSAKSVDLPDIYSRIVKHYIYHRVSSMVSQFTEGLNSCGGLWDIIRSHWDLFAPQMTRVQQPLTLEEFKQLISVCYSPPDSPLRAAEEDSAAHWDTALTLISESKADFSLEELLAFITGDDHPLSLGLPRSVSLSFCSQDENVSGVNLPYASTWTLELFLPTGVAGAADMLELLSRAVHEALGISRKKETERTATWV
ncbi:uncharacterized protein LOC117831916 [Xyrichtys novacula]|uniref:Uncharacterized protein LOC117831916 n=1 Tax=Xyrichtys novacula TaxID=13765 RepID=A0AAV1FIJ6_XYRNO|nr:uncharacterized protein LOC117831916 [Xyrichtys novacula]